MDGREGVAKELCVERKRRECEGESDKIERRGWCGVFRKVLYSFICVHAVDLFCCIFAAVMAVSA